MKIYLVIAHNGERTYFLGAFSTPEKALVKVQKIQHEYEYVFVEIIEVDGAE